MEPGNLRNDAILGINTAPISVFVDILRHVVAF
jgi:hypothetical protein